MLTQLHDALLVSGHVRQRHGVDWLQDCSARELQFSSVQFVCCEHSFSVIIWAVVGRLS